MAHLFSVCKTGEAKITDGFNLVCRHVIHTVGPRYNVKYVTAAEGALYSSYRNVLQLARYRTNHKNSDTQKNAMIILKWAIS